MATQTVVQTDPNTDTVSLTTAAAMGNADTSTSFVIGPCQQAYFSLQGTAGAATLVVQASFDGGTTWTTLKDGTPSAAAMSYTAATANPIPWVPPAGALLRVQTSGGAGTAFAWFITYAKAFG